MTTQSIPSDVSGNVWRIEVTPGQRVQPGDLLLIVESMKMEIDLRAESGGTVSEILVQAGESIVEGQAVLVMTA